MTKGKLKEVPKTGELLTGISEVTREVIRDMKGNPLKGNITPEQVKKLLEIQEEEKRTKGRANTLDLLAEKAGEISEVPRGKRFTAKDVEKWKGKALSTQAVMRSEAAEYDINELKNIDSDSLEIDEKWMYNARTEEKPKPSTSAIAVANISVLTVCLAKEGFKGKEVSDTVKDAVASASMLVKALTGQGELARQPEDLLKSVRDGLNEAAESAGKSGKIEKFDDGYFKNVLDGLSLTNEEKQIRDKVIKRTDSEFKNDKNEELTQENYNKLVKELTTNEGKKDYVKVQNVKELCEGYVKKKRNEFIKKMGRRVIKGELGSENFKKIVEELTKNKGSVENLKKLQGYAKKELERKEQKEQKGYQAPSR